MLNVKINTHGNPIPKQYGEWIDLSTADDVHLSSGQYSTISLGVSMQMPEGYYGVLLPRSSTAMKYGVIFANSIGVIENDYCGDDDIWRFPAYATRDVFVPKGTRIAQFTVLKKPEPICLEQVDFLGNKSRGGLGSTGDR